MCYAESLLPITSWRADIDFNGRLSRAEFERALKEESILGYPQVGWTDEWVAEYWDWIVSDKDDKNQTSFEQVRSKLDTYTQLEAEWREKFD